MTRSIHVERTKQIVRLNSIPLHCIGTYVCIEADCVAWASTFNTLRGLRASHRTESEEVRQTLNVPSPVHEYNLLIAPAKANALSPHLERGGTDEAGVELRRISAKIASKLTGSFQSTLECHW